VRPGALGKPGVRENEPLRQACHPVNTGEGVEYLTAREQREIIAAQFFEYMDNRGDPGDWDEYLACGWPLEPIAGVETCEGDPFQWIV
jgi:hypothetical protein